jgi:hypothetical protein
MGYAESLAVADYDSDGAVDVLTGSGYLRRGLGNGALNLVERYDSINAYVEFQARDTNSDGKMDVIGLSYQSLTTFANESTCRSTNTVFEQPVVYTGGDSPKHLTTADLNRDGSDDVLVANFNGGDLSVFLGNGDGTLQNSSAVPMGEFCTVVVADDFNVDGRIDVATLNSGAGSVTVRLSGPDALGDPLVHGLAGPTRGMALGDFDGNGKPDLVAVGVGDTLVRVLLGNGDGTFTSSTVATSVSGNELTNELTWVASGDLNHDGNQDLAITFLGGRVLTMHGQGTGSFLEGASYEAEPEPSAVDIADLDLDGHLDLCISAGPGKVDVRFGAGDGTFSTEASYETGNNAIYASLADINGDGKLDALVGGSDTRVLWGNGSGFDPTPTVLGTTNLLTRWTKGSDLNRDGRMDVVYTNQLDNDLGVLLNKEP